MMRKGFFYGLLSVSIASAGTMASALFDNLTTKQREVMYVWGDFNHDGIEDCGYRVGEKGGRIFLGREERGFEKGRIVWEGRKRPILRMEDGREYDMLGNLLEEFKITKKLDNLK